MGTCAYHAGERTAGEGTDEEILLVRQFFLLAVQRGDAGMLGLVKEIQKREKKFRKLKRKE